MDLLFSIIGIICVVALVKFTHNYCDRLTESIKNGQYLMDINTVYDFVGLVAAIISFLFAPFLIVLIFLFKMKPYVTKRFDDMYRLVNELYADDWNRQYKYLAQLNWRVNRNRIVFAVVLIGIVLLMVCRFMRVLLY